MDYSRSFTIDHIRYRRFLYREIHNECHKLGCEVLAVNSMPDHVHLAVWMPTTVTAAKLMQRVKGLSSSLVRNDLTPGEFFGWRDGYGVFSFSRSQYRTVINYIKKQKQHHSDGVLWSSVEQFDEILQ